MSALRLPHFLLFAALGLGGTAVHYAVLAGLVQVAGAGVVSATTLGFICGGLVNYTLSRQLVFRSRRPHGEAITRFFTVALSGLLLNAALMALLVDRLALPWLPAQMAVTGLLVVWHYAGNALWTFAERRAA
ncbi:GtrA family protein [Ancylobacter terrae]|uniref:GtrA family protein n=1 Tax=Ancylobacter sp. sgz301288 TaxID=3342077 RepID=UPI00385ADB85